MAEKFKVKEFNVEGLGKITRQENGDFLMDTNDVYKFFEDHGVPEPKQVFKAEKEARNALIEAGAKFLAPHVVERKDRCTLIARVPETTTEITVNGKTENRNPTNNEIITKYGTVSAKVKYKIPAALLKEGGVLSAVAEEVTKGLKK